MTPLGAFRYELHENVLGGSLRLVLVRIYLALMRVDGPRRLFEGSARGIYI